MKNIDLMVIMNIENEKTQKFLFFFSEKLIVNKLKSIYTKGFFPIKYLFKKPKS